MGETITAQRSSMNDARCVDRLIVFFFANRFVVAVVGAVVGSQIEPARARQCHVKAIQNRSRDALGMPRDTQERSERISGTSRERLGSVSGSPRCAPRVPESQQRRPGTPEIAPGSVQEHAKEAKIDSKARPKAKESSVSRAA